MVRGATRSSASSVGADVHIRPITEACGRADRSERSKVSNSGPGPNSFAASAAAGTPPSQDVRRRAADVRRRRKSPRQSRYSKQRRRRRREQRAPELLRLDRLRAVCYIIPTLRSATDAHVVGLRAATAPRLVPRADAARARAVEVVPRGLAPEGVCVLVRRRFFVICWSRRPGHHLRSKRCCA